MYYNVIPLGASRRNEFSYQSDSALDTGQVVTVPFGTGARMAIVSGPGESVLGIKPIREQQPWRIPPRTVELIRWTAANYLAPAGTAAKLALPEYVVTATTEPVTADDRTGSGHGSKQILIQRRRLGVYRHLLTTADRFLVLVPEIALAETFGQVERETGAVRFHSQLRPTERRRIWHGVARGEITKVVGTRAALWLPWPALDAIVVDEEDDRAYKSERTPRYHARTAAAKLAALHDADLVLASAAPSLETWHHGSTQGWQMTVEQEDFPTVSRTSAGTTAEIVDSASLDLLQEPGRHLVWAPERLQKSVVAALERALPDVPRQHFTQTFGSRALVSDFTGRPTGILIGSTALTHPWDFATTHVVVIGLDGLLQLPDFRSGERSHGILRKLAAHATGTMLVQTDHPDHPAISLLDRDPAAFYSQELKERKILKLPPYTRLSRLTASPRTAPADTAAYLERLQAAGIARRELQPRVWLIEGGSTAIPAPIPPGWQIDVDTLNPL
jgi:primosomal protein N'